MIGSFLRSDAGRLGWKPRPLARRLLGGDCAAQDT
jgi:hypothetical protein